MSQFIVDENSPTNEEEAKENTNKSTQRIPVISKNIIAFREPAHATSSSRHSLTHSMVNDSRPETPTTQHRIVVRRI